MNISEGLRTRRSCRAFTAEPVGRSVILAVLDDALCSPSWGNTQPWEIFVAGGEMLKAINKAFSENTANDIPRTLDIVRPEVWPERENERIKELISGVAGIADDAVKMFGEVNERFFYAPEVIYLCMDRRLTSWSMFDLGAISQSIMLAAAERGLATMPAVELVRYPGVLRSYLDIPDSLSVVFGIAIGYEDSLHPINKFKSARRPVSDVARFSGVE